MNRGPFRVAASFLVLACWLYAAGVFAATPNLGLIRAKQEAESRGFIFGASHDEIVAKAKEEKRGRKP